MAKKRHKKHHHEEHIDESWLIPYADLLTLLLALFIVLFASSSINVEKLQQLSVVFNEIFDGGSGVMDNPSPAPVPVPQSPNEEDQQSSAYLEDQKSLTEIQNRVDEYIAVNELENQLATELTDEGLLLTVRDSILFDSGSASIKPEYTNIAADIAQLLEFDPPRSIVVTGHTDNVPMNTPQFASNWELSVSRAVNFLKMIVKNPELDPLLFSAKGYGEFKPIASNDTPEGRAQNRRVEVLIQPLVLKDGSAANEKQ
ncbi:flagellar motor protein MotB [Paenisporosarcina cavernae]|uniref:Flagellar motor protein MotB n=1 Tax=Paenisporosarcina cavernae TaxID=2320858 RepID=A0A385YVD9_9BACL|nr:flagellar motor protein MotB [Paenisporosarcina cavernae]AYC30250.1 flagellar motor protein MotB [Paenisporosarcina cavernae]